MREEATAAEFRSKTPRRPTSASLGSQEEIVDTYLPLVRLVAERVHRRLPPGIDVSSLIHSGIVGLLEALQRYDPGRGVAFQTYARYRIQGEIMEYLRSLDWVSRSVRSWGRRVTAARTRLTGKFGREASPEEMASELGVSLEEYYRVDQKVSDSTLLSLEDLNVASEEEWRRTQEKFANNPYQDPFICIEGKDLVEKLAGAIEVLPERERLVVTLYYHEELTLREIGEILGLTEGRICQIHAQAVTRLRQALGEEDAAETTPARPRKRVEGNGRIAAPANPTPVAAPAKSTTKVKHA
ncbi:MAG: FliA/WhiG family RNA polymerase sigma factor [Deltaproteobacteria bacterium]|nr:FliA/WhiG family RNA polymerase sigma factor [Deltaproteobacteria bacterium]